MATARKTTAKPKTRSTTRKSTTTRRKTSTNATAPTLDKVEDVTPVATETRAPLVEGATDVSTAAVDTSEQAELRKKELIDLVVARSGVKKRDAKPAIEAALAVLGEALSEGRALNLKPMGKAKVIRTKQVDHGQVVNLRLRQTANAENTPQDPLAQAAE